MSDITFGILIGAVGMFVAIMVSLMVAVWVVSYLDKQGSDHHN